MNTFETPLLLVKPLLLSKVEMPANAMQILLDDDVLATVVLALHSKPPGSKKLQTELYSSIRHSTIPHVT
jgi:hypothetical protein